MSIFIYIWHLQHSRDEHEEFLIPGPGGLCIDHLVESEPRVLALSIVVGNVLDPMENNERNLEWLRASVSKTRQGCVSTRYIYRATNHAVQDIDDRPFILRGEECSGMKNEPDCYHEKNIW